MLKHFEYLSRHHTAICGICTEVMLTPIQWNRCCQHLTCLQCTMASLTKIIYPVIGLEAQCVHRLYDLDDLLYLRTGDVFYNDIACPMCRSLHLHDGCNTFLPFSLVAPEFIEMLQRTRMQLWTIETALRHDPDAVLFMDSVRRWDYTDSKPTETETIVCCNCQCTRSPRGFALHIHACRNWILECPFGDASCTTPMHISLTLSDQTILTRPSIQSDSLRRRFALATYQHCLHGCTFTRQCQAPQCEFQGTLAALKTHRDSHPISDTKIIASAEQETP
jgi:hypothetical protein